MFNRDRWREIFETISKNKLRTFLSGFTVALGIFIFIILFGLGNGLKNTFQEFFLDDAGNAIFLYPGKTSKPYKGFKANRRIEFKNEDLKDIEENFSFFLEYLSPRIDRSASTSYKNESNSYTTRAVAPGHQFVEKTILMKGRYVNQSDINKKRKSAVIGRLVAKDLFKAENPIGKYINLGSTAFKVVGVFQDEGGDREERNIYIPFTTRQLIEKGNDKRKVILSFDGSYHGSTYLTQSVGNTLFNEDPFYGVPKYNWSRIIDRNADITKVVDLEKVADALLHILMLVTIILAG